MSDKDEFAEFADAAPSDEFAEFADAQAPDAAAAAAAHDPTEGMSRTDKFLAGAGKGFVDTGRGIYQLGASMGHAAGLVSDEKLAEIQRQVDEQKEQDAPLMATGAGRIGNVVGQAAPMLALPGAGVLGSAAEGAALAATQPVATRESRRQNATLGALGGAGGAAVGKGLSWALGGFGGAGSRQASVNLLKSEGIPLSVAQQTGAKTAQHLERASAMTSDAPAEFAATQNAAFNRAVLRRIGVDDPNVTAASPEVLAKARQSITDVMDDVATRNQVKYDTTLESELSDIMANATRQVPAHDMGPIYANMNDILEGAARNDGTINGTLYQRLNSNLQKLARDPKVGTVASDIHEAINDALQRSSFDEDIAALAKARQQYRALKQIEPATDFATGNISVPKLANSLAQKNNRNQALYGKGDQSLVNLVRAAKHVIPDSLGNSGTAERSLPALSVAEVMGSGEPVKAGLKLVAGKAGLDSAGKALRNQGIVGNTLANGVPGARILAPYARDVIPAVGYGVAQNQHEDAPLERASGGRAAPTDDELVNRLIRRWHAAKRQTEQESKPLLTVPDESIVHALKLSGANI